jgi:hypothetical protein
LIARQQIRYYFFAMIVGPTRSAARSTGQNVLDYEIEQEQAAALGRLGRALEAALAALTHFDLVQPKREAGDARMLMRERLVRDASHALWCFLIQREVCGLRDQRLILREYRVPTEVINRIGVFGAGSATGAA